MIEIEGCLIRANDRALFTMSEGPIESVRACRRRHGWTSGDDTRGTHAYLESKLQNTGMRTILTLQEEELL
jgi:hypothetical protein